MSDKSKSEKLKEYRRTRRGLLGRKLERMKTKNNGTQWSKKQWDNDDRHIKYYNGIDIMSDK